MPPGHGHRSAAFNVNLAAFNAFCRLTCKSTGLRGVRPLQLAHSSTFKPRRPLVGVLGKDLGAQVLRLQISQHLIRSFENKGSLKKMVGRLLFETPIRDFWKMILEIGSRRPNVVPPFRSCS